jgi:molecular chaperone DnaK (HSP70)
MINLNPFTSTTKTNDVTVDTETKTDSKKGFLSGIKDKATEKMLEKQLAAVPEQQREMLKTAIQNNPEFFEKIANKIKEEEKRNGGNQMAASMKIMREHQSELMKIMSGQ